MIVTITSRSSKKEIEAALRKLHKEKPGRRLKKSFDAFKYCGVIKMKEDPMAVQRRLRDEWS